MALDQNAIALYCNLQHDPSQKPIPVFGFMPARLGRRAAAQEPERKP
jgi:hypothetical protein